VSNEPLLKILINVLSTPIVHPVTSYRWVQRGVAFLPPNQLHNHMANVKVMCLHFSFQKHLYNLGIE
jgi:hypothetical protein